MTGPQQNELQKAELQRKLAARRNAPGYESNVRDIEAEITRLDEEIARQRAQGPDGSSPQPLS